MNEKAGPVAEFLIMNHRGKPAFFRPDAKLGAVITFIKYCEDCPEVIGEIGPKTLTGTEVEVKAPSEEGHYCFAVRRKCDNKKLPYYVVSVVKERGEEKTCFTVKGDVTDEYPSVSVAKVVEGEFNGQMADVEINNPIGSKLTVVERSAVENGKKHTIEKGKNTIPVKYPGNGGIVTLSIGDAPGTIVFRTAQVGGTEQGDIVFP